MENTEAIAVGEHDRSFAHMPEKIITLDSARETLFDTLNRLLNSHPYNKIINDEEKKFIKGIFEKYEIDDELWRTLQGLRERDIGACGEPFNYDNLIAASALSLVLGRADLDRDELIELGLGNLLHDIGKASDKIPGSITYKHGKHTKEEARLMMMHPELGYEILILHNEGRPFVLEPAFEHQMCIYHNGIRNAKLKHYPEKTSPDQPTYPARICAIVDAADAILTKRYYRSQNVYHNGDGIYQRAIDELLRESELSEQNPDGVHFDRKLVLKFIPILRRANGHA